jgi:hypothetical protein
MVALQLGTELHHAFFEDKEAAEHSFFALGADLFWQDATGPLSHI